MPDSVPRPPGSDPTRPTGDRLDSWKEIAAYLRRDVTTVQRWEKREGMPVHRHVHDKVGSVYAFRAELDAWAGTRKAGGERSPGPRGPRRWVIGWVAATLLLAATLAILAVRRAPTSPNPLEAARFLQLTDFDGIEQAAALSRDGRFAAFQSDRDGRMDVWVTQVGSGEFRNLTRGTAPELTNPSIRTLGFSPDGTLVTFWARGNGRHPDIGIWAAPLLGGAPRPYLNGAAEFDWSSDGARLVFHTTGPGDPMYVRDPGAEPRKIFSAPPGLHSHFVLWSPDQEFIYFVQGSLPDHLDLWRIPSAGGAPERLTTHDGVVSHPVFLDRRTVLYLATDRDGFGPQIYGLDLEKRTVRRVSFGAEAYTSLAASADGRRIVATRANPKRTLWRVPLGDRSLEMAAATRLPLVSGNGASPRMGPGFVLYVSSKGAGDSIWKLQGGVATEVWSAPGARILGAPAIRRDGRRVAFTVREGERSTLGVMNADGSEARVVEASLELRGAPAWAPDGESITVGAVLDGVPRLLHGFAEGRSRSTLVADHAVDPVWSPAGDLVVYSGADIGTTFPLRAANADGTARTIAPLTMTRGARHVVFDPGGRGLLVLRGEIGHKDLWRVDLDTGSERRLTDLAPDFDVRDFDVSPDGREVVLEQVQEHSDVVLIELSRP